MPPSEGGKVEFFTARRAGVSRRSVAALALAALIVALTMGIAASARATPANTAQAWGINSKGELGDGTTEGPEKCGVASEEKACSTVPIAVSKLSGVKALAGGEEHGYALLENGTVMAWGANEDGMLGDGTKTASDLPVGVCEVGYSGTAPCAPEHYLKGVRAIAAGTGPGDGVALLEDGTVVDWGEMSFADLGDGVTAQSDVPVHVCEAGYPGPYPCPAEHDLKEATAVTAGERFALAMHGPNGEVAGWGSSDLNSSGTSGKGSTFGNGKIEGGTSQKVPVAVCAVGETAPCTNSLSGVTAIASGETHSLALLSTGKVVSWGAGYSGDLGDGSIEGAVSPVEVKGLSEEVKAISAGGAFSLALLKGGTIDAWGSNEDGRLGTGSMSGPEECGELKTPCSTRATPAANGLKDVSTIAAGLSQGLALLGDGSVMAWGQNGDGQLGNGTSTGPEIGCGALHVDICSDKPVKVRRVTGAGGIAGGSGFGASEGFALGFGPPPTVTAVRLPNKKRSHARGPAGGGTTVTITGVGFSEASAVKFGSTNAKSFTVDSPTSITAVSPAASIPAKKRAITVDVTVTDGWGESAHSEGDHFKYRR
jgi:alpha-tubulin suppressor-like RCC1 family protein